jgi:outer membrane lipoprotein-sorting protein
MRREHRSAILSFSPTTGIFNVRYLSSPAALLATMTFVATCALSAQADPSGDLRQAVQNSLKQSSYHMTMVTPASGTIEADVVNPGRTHMLMKKHNMELIVIDQTTYMKQNGTWRKFPGVDFMKTQVNPLQNLAASKGKFTIDDLGPKMIGGAVLHAYRVTNVATKKVAMVFVDGSDRIARIETGADVIQMSKFGQPVTIVAPM